ncbi:hypothetical protein FHQ26_12465 [Testudinibacter sp. TR-2022]|uniref:hypothetical protein n=1 Tax=Testudinibacter sp. TR-2022 TaxID=2585029 RepID=UPI0011180C43|nr:hypothetical protein [Testudinibacter sp. TR-2022]TNH04227.1 hypothetical protein FHQ26_12465 [Testudinibacter sp. TR-2022]
MGIKTNMQFFVRNSLTGLSNEDVIDLTDHILNQVGYVPRNFMRSKERDNFERLFKEKFYEIFNKHKEITPYQLFLYKKKLESESGLLKA